MTETETELKPCPFCGGERIVMQWIGSNHLAAWCHKCGCTELDPKTCEWTQECQYDPSDLWSTGCGNAFQFNEGGPRENGFIGCPFCLGKIVIVEVTDE